jgi:hypothetical protein
LHEETFHHNYSSQLRFPPAVDTIYRPPYLVVQGHVLFWPSARSPRLVRSDGQGLVRGSVKREPMDHPPDGLHVDFRATTRLLAFAHPELAGGKTRGM